jgi:hypothetical protein
MSVRHQRVEADDELGVGQPRRNLLNCHHGVGHQHSVVTDHGGLHLEMHVDQRGAPGSGPVGDPEVDCGATLVSELVRERDPEELGGRLPADHRPLDELPLRHQRYRTQTSRSIGTGDMAEQDTGQLR